MAVEEDARRGGPPEEGPCKQAFSRGGCSDRRLRVLEGSSRPVRSSSGDVRRTDDGRAGAGGARDSADASSLVCDARNGSRGIERGRLERLSEENRASPAATVESELPVDPSLFFSLAQARREARRKSVTTDTSSDDKLGTESVTETWERRRGDGGAGGTPRKRRREKPRQ